MNKNIKVSYKKSYTSKMLTWLTWGAAMLTMAVLVFIIGFVLLKGIPHLSPELFAPHYTSENVSLLPALVNTLFMTLLALLIAAPIGIFAAVFLVEYTDHEGKLVGLIRLTAETLSGIPSIVYGLFGMLFFSTALGWGYSMLAGAFTMAIMILPLIMRTSEEALISVPRSYREASFGLGAGKLRTIFKVVLPAAIPGILSGVILAVGRVAGETAALIFTAGTVAKYAGFMDSGRTLAVHMYVLSNEGLHMDQAYATAVILLIFVFAMNELSEFAARKISKGHENE
ncbi:phosphate ABC transporter permease PstA [Blautia liquoris]|uniref:Phosphate transport system permease protein PstA n=2 Tax=Blautia liquoris TaxID=2779518 RepID=A0A7M2RJ53_9FIRM|nr:phosphate ABC transporter permease PstA [Blautia liquoris]QOV19577.1 phosphate ABC transporter permease PstA [Blautia liquoris]